MYDMYITCSNERQLTLDKVGFVNKEKIEK